VRYGLYSEAVYSISKKEGSRVHYGLVVALGLGPNHLFVWAGKRVGLG
jgi:hypothetical protein